MTRGHRTRFTAAGAALVGARLGERFRRFTPADLAKGMDVELEHGRVHRATNVTGDDLVLTAKIALAHLRERPDYYELLEVVERMSPRDRHARRNPKDVPLDVYQAPPRETPPFPPGTPTDSPEWRAWQAHRMKVYGDARETAREAYVQIGGEIARKMSEKLATLRRHQLLPPVRDDQLKPFALLLRGMLRDHEALMFAATMSIQDVLSDRQFRARPFTKANQTYTNATLRDAYEKRAEAFERWVVAKLRFAKRPEVLGANHGSIFPHAKVGVAYAAKKPPEDVASRAAMLQAALDALLVKTSGPPPAPNYYGIVASRLTYAAVHDALVELLVSLGWSDIAAALSRIGHGPIVVARLAKHAEQLAAKGVPESKPSLEDLRQKVEDKEELSEAGARLLKRAEKTAVARAAREAEKAAAAKAALSAARGRAEESYRFARDYRHSQYGFVNAIEVTWAYELPGTTVPTRIVERLAWSRTSNYDNEMRADYERTRLRTIKGRRRQARDVEAHATAYTTADGRDLAPMVYSDKPADPADARRLELMRARAKVLWAANQSGQTAPPPVFENPRLPRPIAHADRLYVRTQLVRDARAGRPPKIRGAKDVAALVAALSKSDQERRVVVALDTKRRLLGVQEVAVGGTSNVSVPIRHAIKLAVLTGASFVYLAHNHPSGDPTPSATDVAGAKRMAEAFRCAGLQLEDSVIVAGNRYTSLKARGQFVPLAVPKRAR